jgi:4-hydroxybenzoate polyprenyltransferase
MKSESSYPAIRFVSGLSHGAWQFFSPLMRFRWFSKIRGLLTLVRPGRVLMVSSLTWVSAFVANVPWPEQSIITLGGAFLAMAGFALDFYTDSEADRKAPRPWPINPISTGMMEAKTARRWIVFFVLSGLSLCAWADLFTLVPAAVVLFIYWGLAEGFLDGPVGRAITLGLLQALYVLLAAAATGRIPVLMLWIAAVFFAAMVGARAAADIRDLPTDLLTETKTLPKVIGVQGTSWIMPIAITISALISLGIYQFGPFDQDYLIWTLVSFGPAVILAWSFPFRPTPNYAFILVWPYWGIGILYMVALVTGHY